MVVYREVRSRLCYDSVVTYASGQMRGFCMINRGHLVRAKVMYRPRKMVVLQTAYKVIDILAPLLLSNCK